MLTGSQPAGEAWRLFRVTKNLRILHVVNERRPGLSSTPRDRQKESKQQSPGDGGDKGRQRANTNKRELIGTWSNSLSWPAETVSRNIMLPNWLCVSLVGPACRLSEQMQVFQTLEKVTHCSITPRRMWMTVKFKSCASSLPRMSFSRFYSKHQMGELPLKIVSYFIVWSRSQNESRSNGNMWTRKSSTFILLKDMLSVYSLQTGIKAVTLCFTHQTVRSTTLRRDFHLSCFQRLELSPKSCWEIKCLPISSSVKSQSNETAAIPKLL